MTDIPKVPKGRFSVWKGLPDPKTLHSVMRIEADGYHLNLNINQAQAQKFVQGMVQIFGSSIVSDTPVQKAQAPAEVPKEDPWLYGLAQAIYQNDPEGKTLHTLLTILSPLSEECKVSDALLDAGAISWAEWEALWEKWWVEPSFREKLHASQQQMMQTALLSLLQKKHATKTTKVTYQGMSIVIDRPKGFVQTGKDAQGNEWTRTYTTDYGYFQKTEGGDGEPLDVFVGNTEDAPYAFWVTQLKADGSFDEYKVILGVNSQAEALAVYKAHVPEQYFGGMVEVPLSLFKCLLGISPTEMYKAFTEKSTLDSLFRALWKFQTQAQDLTPPSEPVRKFLQKAQLRFLTKAENVEERYVFGEVLVPEEKDLQNDIYSAEEVRKAAFNYMMKHRNLGDMHQKIVTKGDSLDGPLCIVENFLAPMDLPPEVYGSEYPIKKGTWLMGCKVLDDAYWQEYKTGKRTGWSIGGDALRTKEA